ncbi:hypothetical protein [Halobacillus litoralis]|uniref:hypothetical protein n=1 Tax=Halobacillus litoralis TaxID=45668 RepID=UPI001CD46510|nr:hypothetical protein [Halobacillus litoralis]MCA1023683.1 hypothetical protein [Halobacillus litoralis]
MKDRRFKFILRPQDFQLDECKASLWKAHEERRLQLESGEFEIPDSPGSYILEVTISLEFVKVQYAGNIEIVKIQAKDQLINTTAIKKAVIHNE